MRTTRYLPAIMSAYAALVAVCSAVAQQTAPVWTVGQEWRFLVKQYDRTSAAPIADPRRKEEKLVPRVQYEFQVGARVVGVTKRDARECVQVKFTAGPDVPVVNSTNPPEADIFRSQEYTLTLDAETWRAVELDGKEMGGSGEVHRAEGCTALLTQALCFPVDWVIARSDLDDRTERTEMLDPLDFHPRPDYPTPSGALRRMVFPEKDGTVRITVGRVDLIPRKSTGEPPEEARREVEQVWHPNEPWWRSFRRFSNGHVDLEAILVSDPGGAGKAIEVQTPAPRAGARTPAGPTWAIGQEWRFLVKDYSNPATPAKAQFEFHMKARVVEFVKEDGHECARIEFTSESDAPGMYTALFTLVVNRQTWSPVRWEYPKKHGGVRAAAEAEGYRALLPTTMGIPLDWVVLRSDLANAAPCDEFFHFPGLKSIAMFGLKRSLSAPQADGTRRITVGLWVPRENQADATYEPAKDAMCEVEQVWHPGELWWRSFRRLNHGRLELEATRVSEGVQP